MMKARQFYRLLMMALMLVGTSTSIHAQEYITEVMTIGAEKSDDAKKLRDLYTNKGYTVLNNDLNRGARGWYVYIIWKTSSTANPETGYITDICVSDKKVDFFAFEGRTYHRASNNNGFNGDLNRGSGGADIWLYYTRDRGNLGTYGADKRVITKLSVTNKTEDGDNSTAAISWRNSSKYDGICDLNKGAGGDDIFLQQHFTTQTLKWKEKPVFASDLTYDGKTKNLIAKDTWKNNYGTLKYRLDGGSWSSTIPGAIEVGTYMVEAYLDGKSVSGLTFADNSNTISQTVTINPPVIKANSLDAVFNQSDKKVNLTWDAGTLPGNYTDYKWVIYRNDTKIAELPHQMRTYADSDFDNETTPTYDVYYVSDFWDKTTKRDDAKATVSVSTVRSVPANNLLVEQQADRIVFTWNSDGYAEGFGNKFRIYLNDEEDPIFTLKATDMQTSFRWEHRSTDQHTNRQNKVDPETGVPYTEEPLNACSPNTYRIEGVIGDVVLNTYTITPKAIGEATKFYGIDASKGAYEGSVKLSWHVDQQGSLLAKTYIVERRRAEQESEAWEVLTRLSSNEDYLFYTDETALPGVYYDYRVTVEDKCSDGTIINTEVTNIGFAKSTGTLTGRIAYGSTGTAVQGVDVVMTKTSSAGDDLEQFHSMYFTDANGVVTWQYPSESYAQDKFATGDFSVQTWLYPEAFSESTVVDFGSGIGLGMTANGGLTFNNQPFSGIALQQNVYNHIVLTRNGKTLTCYVLTRDADSSEPNVQKATLTMADGTLTLASAKAFSLGRFKGAVDEFRLWTKCLSEADILKNYDHLLVGDEKQLETYWTFDEGLRTQFFDYSRDGTNYRKHHGLVVSNAQASTLTPRALSLKAKTDADGNYIIQGIPFTGEGTSYSVLPLYGVHEFNPNRTLLFVGSNALVHTANFEDVSSFPMSGHIYYAGTNVPVEGVQLYVDGLLQTSGGQVEQTDENGYYEISVPIGKHFVEAKLGGHTMVEGGRWPTKGTFDFDRRVQHDFADSTLVNFVGRVAGGLSNDTLAVGLSLSKNNIGMATIQLALNNESFSFNCLDDHITTATTNRSWESDTTSICSRSWTGTDDDAKYIFIRTDSLNGEFSALLPPLKYKVKSLRIDKNPNIDFGSLPEIDLTNISQQQSDEETFLDEEGNEEKLSYTYNTKMVKTWFSEPKLVLTQMSVNGDGDAPKGVFGRTVFEDWSDDFGTSTINDIWTIDKDGKTVYTYGYPIYDIADKVKMSVWGYEAYMNYDSTPAVADTIPLNGQVVTISNEMSSEQMVVARVDDESLGLKPGDIYDLKKDQLILDTRGLNEFTFRTGLPNIAAPYTRQLSLEMERNNRTYTYNGVNAIVLGSLTTGTNFVTLGPDIVTMVLRDPPGATSKTTWTTGSTKTKLRSETQGYLGSETFKSDQNMGAAGEVEAGMAVLVQTAKYKLSTDVGGTYNFDVSYDNKTDRTWSTTATKSVSTGTGQTFVGSAGDVFIGASTNIIVGNCRKLGFFRKGIGYPFELDLKDAISVDDSIKTSFTYSAYELENVMIPKWEETRRSLFTFVKDKAEAQAYVNTSNRCVYATWLNEDDPNLGIDEDTYIQIIPKNAKENEVFPDSVRWCTDQIESWHQVLADNEQDKVEAIADHDYFKRNISFDGGTSTSYSERCDTTYQRSHSYQHKMSMAFRVGFTSEETATVLYWKLVANNEIKNGWHMATTESDPDENHKEWAQFDYSFSDGNKGTDFSTNIYKSPRGYSDSFYLVGGQSYNPYERQEKTKYYEPGKFIISNGTEQMERPDIRISLDGNGDNSSKHVTLSDVPAGQPGQFTLHLTNLSSTSQGFDFSYNIMVQEKSNQEGLEVLMDGVPANGRSVFIPAGETVKKVITVRQTDQSALDYADLEIWFMSQYQPIKINDKVTFDVHFVPSSSPVDLIVGDPVLNIETLGRNGGDLELKVTNFDRQFKGMKKVGVEYRFEGSTTWTRPDTLTFYVNRADSTKLHDQVLPTTGDLRLHFNMNDDNFYPQGNYTFRAYTTTTYGTNDIDVYSSEVTVVKDNVRPRNITTPTPTNGVLRYGDDISLEFNEDIVPGYVSDKNIIVTAKLNNQPVNHEVSYQLIPRVKNGRTANPLFLNGDFSVDFWFKWTQEGTLIQLGQGQNAFSLGINQEGHVVFTILGKEYVSVDVVPKDTWTYLVYSYNTATSSFSALAQYDTTTMTLFDNQQAIGMITQAVSYTDDNYLYLGPGTLDGAIHDLSLFNIYRDIHEAAATKYQSKDNYVYGLANYWPMNEGHGTVLTDTRHTHDFDVLHSWLIDNDNRSPRLLADEYFTANISGVNTGRNDSYAIEMWVNSGSKDEGATIFETGTTPANKLRLYYGAGQNLWLDYGEKSQMVIDAEAMQSLNIAEGWDHLALNVVRGQSASFYFNGKRTAVINEADVPPVEGSTMTLGKGYTGSIDEVRYWRAAISEKRLLSNMFCTIDTADVYSRGLAAYYPFERRSTINGVERRIFSLNNMAPGTSDQLTSVNGYLSGISSPPLKTPLVESRLIAKPIASERKLVISLNEGSGIKARDIEGTTLNITVDKIHDMHGNESNPIRWTSYVQMNTLKWTKDSVNIIKKYGDDYTFDVIIENRSGNTEYYTLYSTPQWLTLVDSERTDEVAPLSTKTLRFKVNPLVAVGNYDITIGLQGNKEILEPLRIVMKVLGEKPTWRVDPNAYENTMSVVGQIYINGILIGNNESLLAAFIGDECRGVVSPKQVRGAAYVAMSIYGTAQQTINNQTADLDKGQPVTFRIWDATTGMTYSNVNISMGDGSSVVNSIEFDPTVSYGNFDKPIVFTKSNLVEQPLYIHTGWNWLSLGVEPSDTKVSEVFKDLATWNTQLKDKATGVAYSRGNYWTGSLKEVHANTMYKLQLTRMEASNNLPEPLIINGEQVKLAETPVTIGKDWNWIAFTPMTTMPIGQAFAAANPQRGDQVKSQTGFAYYGPYGWEGNLEALESGKGYLYFSTDIRVKSFVYPTLAASARSRNANRTSEKRQSSFSPVEPTDYPDNMAIVIMLTDGSRVITDAEVAAFIGSECRGAAFADEGLYYLLVAGEGSGQPIEIRANVNGSIKTVCTILTYVSDGSIGTPWEPFVIDINDLTGINDIRVPVSDGVWYTLQGIRYGTTRPTKSGVYLYNGKKVVIRPNHKNNQ